MKIGFDLDGVLCDSSPVFRTMLFEKFKTKDFKNKDDAGNERFRFEIAGVDDLDIWNAIHKCLFHCQEFMSPMAWANDLLSLIYQIYGDPIPIITARPEDTRKQTLDWLEANIHVPTDTYIVEPPTNDTNLKKKVKNELVNELGLEYFVEDRFKYASDISQNCPNIKCVYLLNRPYNKGRRVGAKVERIDSLRDVVVF